MYLFALDVVILSLDEIFFVVFDVQVSEKDYLMAQKKYLSKT